MAEENKTNAGQGLGIAGLVLGIIAVIVSFIPCVGLIALVPGLVGIVLSAIGLNQANKGNGAKGLIIAALVISIIGTSVAVVWGVFLGGVAKEGSVFKNKIEKTLEEEFGEDYEETLEDFGEEMEESLKDLEKSDGEEMSDEPLTEDEFNEILTDYEELVNEYVKLIDKAQDGNVSAMSAYSKTAVKAAALATRLAAAAPRMSEEQQARFEEIHSNYEDALQEVE
ncbi:MAG: DUF4190 domain-containing protein [Bacteroidota bacterium]